MKQAADSAPVRRIAARQAGIALIALVAFIGIAAAVFVVRSLNADALAAAQNQRTVEALQVAREALLAFAAADDNNRPGTLPCPDINGDGDSLATTEYSGSNCVSSIGRLPWKRLRIPELRDASGELLWYAVSPAFNNAGPNNVMPAFMTGNTSNMLTINGLPGTFGAIVFAPGPALQGQIRSGVALDSHVNYLDGVNATPTLAFSAQLPGPAFNDRLLPISSADLVAAAGRRVSREVAEALRGYFDFHGFLPAPSAFDELACVNTDLIAPGDCPSTPGILAGRLPASMAPAAAYDAVGSDRPQNRPSSALLNGTADSAQYGQIWLQRQHWREHVIYLVSQNCVGPPATKCPTGSLDLRGAGGNVDNARFIVLVAGMPRPGQSRASPADKQSFGNYLEAPALSAVQALAAGKAPTQVQVPAGTIVATPRTN
jgi:type II secretory pathway pseudopilin PulG